VFFLLFNDILIIAKEGKNIFARSAQLIFKEQIKLSDISVKENKYAPNEFQIIHGDVVFTIIYKNSPDKKNFLNSLYSVLDESARSDPGSPVPTRNNSLKRLPQKSYFKYFDEFTPKSQTAN